MIVSIALKNVKNFDKQFDKIIFVSAPEEVRLQRAMQRDKCDEDNVRSRMRLQWNEETKISKSDYIINNNGVEDIIPQIVKINSEIQNLKISELVSCKKILRIVDVLRKFYNLCEEELLLFPYELILKNCVINIG